MADQPTRPSAAHRVRERFSVLAQRLAAAAGSAWTSGVVAVGVVVMLVVGMVTGFPAWWQTTAYSAGALISVLVLFSIQHTTHRQTTAIMLKLDELVAATSGADDAVIGVEDSDLREQERIVREARAAAQD